ncbi:hypothetical protein E8K88_05720 [Lampropedia aestuarii]|uniref:Uncharacterized protein n=1 Tax=Lampropedia aestuarii TaxID=2562762 RepID=A0A4S5BQD8_9BURK|nr:hypothetical protein [Lampropedia aestuarii]THJ34977.1 hypothetical protein E8K88_05720 [Lampropedia aestuarii]
MIINSLIKSITSKEDALFEEKASFSDETPQDCKEFILSEAQIRNFFQTATTISQRGQRDYDHELIPSRCYAKGKLRKSAAKAVFGPLTEPDVAL